MSRYLHLFGEIFECNSIAMLVTLASWHLAWTMATVLKEYVTYDTEL